MQCVAVVLQCVGVVLQCAGMRVIHQDIVNVIPLNYLQIYIIFMCSLLYTHAAVPQCAMTHPYVRHDSFILWGHTHTHSLCPFMCVT